MGRIAPLMGVQAYRSFTVAAPLATHWRPASCDEVACEQMAGGWITQADESIGIGRRVAHLARTCGRRFTEHRGWEPLGIPATVTVFWFAPGQQCFRPHKVLTGRPERFITRDGDWRGNPTGRRREHVTPDDWVDDFATHQIGLAENISRG